MRIVYADLGRGPRAKVAKAWDAVRKHGQDADAVVVTEINEGDKGYDDVQLARRRFGRFWRKVGLRTKAGAFIRRRVKVSGKSLKRAAAGIRGQSPVRWVNSVRLDGGVTLVWTKYPAGYRNGARPRAVRALLGVAWRAVFARHRRAIRKALERGDDVITPFDGNDRNFPWRDLAPEGHDVELLFKDAPDYGVAIAAKGRRVGEHTHTDFALGIEPMHRGHEVAVEFTPRRKP